MEEELNFPETRRCEACSPDIPNCLGTIYNPSCHFGVHPSMTCDKKERCLLMFLADSCIHRGDRRVCLCSALFGWIKPATRVTLDPCVATESCCCKCAARVLASCPYPLAAHSVGAVSLYSRMCLVSGNTSSSSVRQCKANMIRTEMGASGLLAQKAWHCEGVLRFPSVLRNRPSAKLQTGWKNSTIFKFDGLLTKLYSLKTHIATTPSPRQEHFSP